TKIEQWQRGRGGRREGRKEIEANKCDCAEKQKYVNISALFLEWWWDCEISLSNEMTELSQSFSFPLPNSTFLPVSFSLFFGMFPHRLVVFVLCPEALTVCVCVCVQCI